MLDCVRIEVLEDGKERLSHRLAAMFYTDKCDPMSPAASRHCCMDTAREVRMEEGEGSEGEINGRVSQVKDSFDGMLDLEKKRGQASPVSGMTILKYIETSQHCGVDRGVSGEC